MPMAILRARDMEKPCVRRRSVLPLSTPVTPASRVTGVTPIRLGGGSARQRANPWAVRADLSGQTLRYAKGYEPHAITPVTEVGNPASSAPKRATLRLSAIVDAGVTFAASMVERVIEERARGDQLEAARIRAETVAKVELIGGWDNVQVTSVSADEDRRAWARARSGRPASASTISGA